MDVLEPVDFGPNERVSVEVLITEAVIRQNDDGSLRTSLALGPQGQDEVLDAFDYTAHNNVAIDVLV